MLSPLPTAFEYGKLAKHTVNRATYGGGISSAPAPPIEMEIKVGVHELNTPVTATVSSWLRLRATLQALVVLRPGGDGYTHPHTATPIKSHSWQAL